MSHQILAGWLSDRQPLWWLSVDGYLCSGCRVLETWISKCIWREQGELSDLHSSDNLAELSSTGDEMLSITPSFKIWASPHEKAVPFICALSKAHSLALPGKKDSSSLQNIQSWIFVSYLHIEFELPKVLIKVLFCALFGGKELFWVLFWVLLIVPELFWALFKALYFALLWNTFLGNLLKHYFENFFGGKELFWAPFLVLFKVLKLSSALYKALHFTLFSWTFWGHFLKH